MLKNNLEEIHEGVSKFLNKLNYETFRKKHLKI